MTCELKLVNGRLFCFLFVITQWTTTFSAEDGGRITELHNNRKLPQAKLGEFCWVEFCQENQFCNDEFICQCRPGYKVYNNDCVPVAGENKECKKHEDCHGKLVCINGLCRKIVSNNEFVTLAQICLGITVTAIIIAVFSTLIKYLLKYDSFRAFRRQNDISSLNSSLTMEASNQIHEEKPPSYEECIRSTERGSFTKPPPYIISTNSVNSGVENDPVRQLMNYPVVNTHNLTPLNVRNLIHETNQNVKLVRNSQEIDDKNTK